MALDCPTQQEAGFDCGDRTWDLRDIFLPASLSLPHMDAMLREGLL